MDRQQQQQQQQQRGKETIREGGKQLRVDCSIAAAVELCLASGGGAGTAAGPQATDNAETEVRGEEKLRQHAGSGAAGGEQRANCKQQEISKPLACSNNIHTSLAPASRGRTNQAEMIADDSEPDNMNYLASSFFVETNEHANCSNWNKRRQFEPKQAADLCCGPPPGCGAAAGPEAEVEPLRHPGAKGSLLGIVESAESKLMRQSGRPASDLLSGNSREPNRSLRRQPMSLLLKSPAFATNTLDETHLDKLAAASGRRETLPETRRCRAGSGGGAGELEEHEAGDLDHFAGRLAATNMTNRLNEGERNNNEQQQQQQQQQLKSGDDVAEDKQPRGADIPFGSQRRPQAAGWQPVEALKAQSWQEVRARGRKTGAGSGPANDELARRDSASAQQDYDDHEPDDDDDDDDDDDLCEEREAPTPTNDLIRALIHKDRQALGVLAGGGASGETPGSEPPGRRRLNLTGDLPAAGSTNAKQPRNQIFDLSALIGKCQRLQFSGAKRAPEVSECRDKQAPYQQMASNRQQQRPFAARCSSPRKPSDPSALLRAQEVAEANRANLEQQAQLQMRRHSTYMLPILLNSKTARPGDKSSSSSSSGGGDRSGNNSAGSSDSGGGPSTSGPDEDEEDSLSGGCAANERKRDSINFRLASEPQTASADELSQELEEADEPADGAELEDLDKDLLMVEARDFRRGGLETSQRRRHLPSSASSPSALSTPTNERPTANACQGPCCAPLPVPRAPPPGPALKQGRCETIRQQIFARLQHHQHRRRASGGGGGAEDRRGRKRLGSNPLDRLRAGSEQSAAGLRNRRGAPAPASKSAGKRHSIINIFSSNHQPSRLFSSSSTNNQQPRLSSGQLEGQQHEPLIPESGFKIVVMGTSGSGKTSIIQRFMYNSFTWRHLPTVEDTYFIEFPYLKNTINISISDTSGTYQFPAMRKLAINSGDAFILVYSVDNAQSFDDLETLRQTILEEREQAYLEASGSINCATESSSAFASASNATSTTSIGHHCPLSSGPQQPPPAAPSSHHDNINNRDTLTAPHHWSLASLFHNNNNNSANNQTNVASISSSGSSMGQTSLSSSLCSSSNCSSTDNSRRSSISAAEAALKTRRTRHPPIVIVANKHDLPEDQHLVNSDEIEALAVIDWNNGFVRASAALDWNINEIFQQVLKQARQPQTLADAIVSKRRKSLPPKLPHSMISNSNQYSHNNNTNANYNYNKS